jgi:hypothetical protein
MKRSLSIIGLVFALVGMLAGTALAGPQYAFLCDPDVVDDCRGSALVFEIPTSGREILKSWAVEVQAGVLEPDPTSINYGLFNNDGDPDNTCGGIMVLPLEYNPDTKGYNGDKVIYEDVQEQVDVCEIDSTTPPILTGTLRKGAKPRRH